MSFRWTTAGWLVLAVAAAGCSNSDKPAADGSKPAKPSGGVKRFILLTNGDSPYWNACRAGVESAQQELKLADAGFQAVMETNDGTLARQLEQIRSYGSQDDVAGIGVCIIDAANASVADELRALRKKGIAVITFDSDVDRGTYRDARTAFIGTDNYAGGVELGKCAAALSPDGGKYATFVGLTGAQNAIDRIRGVADGAGPKFESLDNLGDEFDPSRARENVRNAIRNHPELNFLVGIYAYNAPAIADVVTEIGRRKDFTIVTFDAEAAAIEHMAKGNIDAMVVQDPFQMGYQGVRLLRALVEDDQKVIGEMLPHLGETDGDIFNTGLKVVVPDASSPIKPALFSKQTQFMTLQELKDWMARYKLTDT